MPTLPQWANLLRAVDADGTDLRELPGLLRLSKRTVRSGVAASVRSGLVEEVGSGGGRCVHLTDDGRGAAAQWGFLRGSAEEQWRGQVKVEGALQLRASLEGVVAQLPLEHPHYPAGYGVADARITGGNGRDWKAVPRGKGDTVSDLPLSALLSQAVVAYALAYEEMSEVALSLSALVIRRVPPEGRSATGLGSSAGLSALVRHGFLQSKDEGNGPIVRLTPKGQAISDAYEDRVLTVEREWSRRFGGELIGDLRNALDKVLLTPEP
jgi:hypothetical protein